MPVLDNLKHFIRHGKPPIRGSQALGEGSDPSANGNVGELPKPRAKEQAKGCSDTTQDSSADTNTRTDDPTTTAPTSSSPSTLAISAVENRGEQRWTGESPIGGQKAPATSAVTTAKAHAPEGQQHYTREAEQMVAEEKQAKNKMPYYEGLSERFTLLEKMGDGAFSNVYKAVDRQSGQKVAVKVVRKYELNSSQEGKHLDPQFRKKNRVTERANILKEVQIMRNLKHSGIVELLSFSESRDYYFLVLELMEGGELFHQIVKLTYFSEPLARHVILQVAHAIRYLHEERGVVHRDIKPENLLFEAIPIVPSKVPKARQYDEDKEDEGEFMPGIGGGGIGRVKIADFGLSKVVWDESTMTPCGTVGYTAPEIVKDERYSKSVDMWALGCVLYTLLCGFPPFYDESINVLTEKVAKGAYTFLSPWWDDIGSSAKDLITHLLCVDPEQRYTIDEFLAHPWCNEKDPAPTLNSAEIALVKQAQMPIDSPLLRSMAAGNARASMKSPGLASLKEAFDVTYAVHRMEEEGARRRAHRIAGQAGFLHGLNEEEEDEDELEEARRRLGPQAARAIEQQRGARHGQQAQQQQQQQQQAAAAAAVAAQYQGRGGADRHAAEVTLYDGRAGQYDRGTAGGRANNRRGGGGFELNIDNATLLGRRHKAAGSLSSLADGSPIACAGSTPSEVPGSPMRID